MTRTPATIALAVLTAAASVAAMFSGSFNYWVIAGGIIPARVSDSVLLPPEVVFAPVWATPLTATLLHDGGLHLGFNLVMLVYAGRVVEQALGTRGLLVLYLIGAYAAAAAQWAFGPMSPVPTIGASGAISALVGAYALLFPTDRVRAIGPIPASVVRVLWLALGWALLNLLVGFAFADAGMPIAAGAHIGGFLAGLVLFRPLLVWRWRTAGG